MANDPEGLVTFEANGSKFTAVFGFKAMKATEIHYDKPFFKAIQSTMPQISLDEAGDQDKLNAAIAEIHFSDIGNLFQFSLLKHHPELTEAEVEDIVDEIGLEKVSEIIGAALSASMAKEGDDGSSANPPKKSRSRKTG